MSDPREKVDRNSAVVARRAEGLTLLAVGLEFGISQERVRQIVRREAEKKYLADIKKGVRT